MKKFLKLGFCLMLVIVLAGCSFNFNKKDETTTNNNETVTKKESSDKIAEFVDQYKASIETFSNSTITATLLARGKSIVYSYTYVDTYTEEQTTAMKPALETAIDESKNVFTDLLTELRKIDPEAESVIVEYYNGDNTLITSIEYK